MPENSALPFRDPKAFIDQEIAREQEAKQEQERLRLEAERISRRLGISYDPRLVALYGSPFSPED